MRLFFLYSIKMFTYLFIIPFFLLCQPAFALEVNDDGKELLDQATQAFRDDMGGRPVITDKKFISYVNGVTKKLQPKGRPVPSGVRINTTIIESDIPEVYSYVNGNIVVTTGAIFAADNEAQLATLLSHEVAHLVEGHYISMYQEIKASERRQRRKAAAGAIFGVLLDSAVDYVVEVETAKQYDQLWKGESTYLSTSKSVATIHAAESTYIGLKDVVSSIPAKDEKGDWIDPRQRFEVVADAQGMEYLAIAGYDVNEASKAWSNVHKIKSDRAREKEKAMGPWAAQMRQSESMMRMMSARMRQSLGASGLVQTISDSPPSRPGLMKDLVNLKEVHDVQPSGKGNKGIQEYQGFLKNVMLPRAEKALMDESYGEAEGYYRALYNKGLNSARIVYGLAKSSIGDFAFSASEDQKRETEKLYREAARMDKKYAEPYRGLGELYEDWDRYGDAASAYQTYLKLAPKAKDSAKLKRKITTLKKKASR
ncbi:MAG: M48 family metalloprotease [Nitrospirota bacterium]|nr:MAG: M48 family metalloprotease [Nitrospirota bacterium]